MRIKGQRSQGHCSLWMSKAISQWGHVDRDKLQLPPGLDTIPSPEEIETTFTGSLLGPCFIGLLQACLTRIISSKPHHVYGHPHFAHEKIEFTVAELHAQDLSKAYRIRNEDGRKHALSFAV